MIFGCLPMSVMTFVTTPLRSHGLCKSWNLDSVEVRLRR